MSVQAKPLVPSTYASDGPSLLYQVPSGVNTIIDKFTATNNDSGSRLLSVWLVTSNGSTNTSNQIVNNLSMTAGTTYDISSLQNQILGPNESIWVGSDAASVVAVRVSGRETA